ncbi:DUF503 domain-containing protein [Candidatus Omnitrophota bacterium]
MTIGLLTVELIIPSSQSLKDKRQVLRSLKDRLRNNFNISLAEIDGLDKWQRAVIAIVKVDGKRANIDKAFAHIVGYIEKFNHIELNNYEMEML